MNGLMVFIPLIVFFICAPSLYSSYFSVDYQPYEDQRILDSLLAVLDEEVIAEKSILFSFDPNRLPQDSLLMLGLNSPLVQRIVNYRKAKGVFREAKDLSKIYGMPDSLFQALLPFVEIAEQPKAKVDSTSAKALKRVVVPRLEEQLESAEEMTKIDINQSDSVTLMQLRGIGPVYAGRIVRFRDALGGFYTIEQINEVYGISDSLFQSIAPRLVIEDTTLRKLNVNLASFKEVNRHPYISYEQTKDIFNAKSNVGKYKSWTDLLQLKTFDSLSAQRLIFYLEFK